jgi:homoserine dehydrogenase
MRKEFKIMLYGLGKVGRQVLAMLNHLDLPVALAALSDSSACLTGDPLTSQLVENAIRAKEAGERLSHFPGSQPLSALPALFTEDLIIIDTSVVKDMDWKDALNKGCRLVFANKNALSAPWRQAKHLFSNPNVRYEATVGAGLPVIASLASQVASGDPITRVEGVMSGTLGFLCSRLEQGASYSQAVRDAYDAGYTEPDPRDDLSGFDVLRKTLILARTAGWQMEKEEVEVLPLYDKRLLGMPLADFFEASALLNADYAAMAKTAAENGNTLRYLATVTARGGRIGLREVAENSALGALNGPGNYFAFYSRNYNPDPLVIAGPGAGATVTANGVINDIIALIQKDSGRP